MVGDWKTARLGDLVDSSLGKMLDTQKNKGTPRPYLGNSNVRWGSFDLQNLSLMRFENDDEEQYGIRDGDLIICEGGEPGRCAIWREKIPGMADGAAYPAVRPDVVLASPITVPPRRNRQRCSTRLCQCRERLD